MATYSNTGEIQRQAPGVKKAGKKRAKGWRNAQNYLTGRDQYGRASKGVHKTLGQLAFIGTAGTAGINARKNARGQTDGAKQVRTVTKAGWNAVKTSGEIVLTVATMGGYAGISAGAKGVSAGAKAASVAAKGAKGFGASVKAASAAYKTHAYGTAEWADYSGHSQASRVFPR